jgi:EAL domain-containing protein (putative c-di-GMP-specific phosphodiesterase class I)
MFKTRGAGAGSTPFQGESPPSVSDRAHSFPGPDFLKQNMKLAKAAMPKATHGEVMRALSERWKAIGGAKTAAEIVETGEDPMAAQRADAEYWQVMSLQMQGLSIA